MGKPIIICKKTGKVFYDVNNTSGSITTHLLSIYDNIDVPSNNYQRKKYEKKYGKKWFDDYFTKSIDEEKEKRICKICGWETVDVDNRSGVFESHLNKSHSITLDLYLNKYPEDVKYHPNYVKTKKKEDFFVDSHNFITCMICGEKMKFITNTHLRNKHGITMEMYKLKYPNASVSSKTTSKKLSNYCHELNTKLTPNWTSAGETEIKDFITGLGIEVKKGSNRSLLEGKEIDILIPSHNLAIEYNGLYYHTEKMGKHSTYHINKTTECFNNGYELIQIFEDEWTLKKDIVKTKLKHILGCNKGIRIGARNVMVKEINSSIKNKFLDDNHIQGSTNSNISYGAYYNNILVAVICFNNDRNMSKRENGVYDMVRFAVHKDYVISGMCSKFIKKFITDYTPMKIITFADRRWTPLGDNNLYTKMGFTLTQILRPSYTYYNSKINRYKRYHKFSFGKTNLKRLYPDINFTLSEKEIMESLGYSRIWDCGLFKYELVINKVD